MPEGSSAARVSARISCSAALVQHDGRGFQRGEAGVRVKFDLLLRHHELRLFHRQAIHHHPAARDIKLGLAAGARQCFGEAFCETYGGCHDKCLMETWSGIVYAQG